MFLFTFSQHIHLMFTEKNLPRRSYISLIYLIHISHNILSDNN